MNPAEHYILSKPEPFRTILIELRQMILAISEDVNESYKWNLPFYDVKKQMFCFLNFRKTYVDLGIPYGINLTRHQEYLIDGENRKKLRSIRFYTLADINHEVITDVLNEAFNNLRSS